MATYYVSSVDGDDADDGNTWALAKQTIAGALAVATADGDFIYVDSAHAYVSGAAITWNVATASTRIYIISVDRNGSTTTGHNGWLAGAKETVGVNAAGFLCGNLRAPRLFIYGITIETDTGSSASNSINFDNSSSSQSTYYLSSCTLSARGSSAIVGIGFGITPSTGRPLVLTHLENCTLNGQNSANGSSSIFSVNHSILTAVNLTVGFSGANHPPSMMRTANPLAQIHISDSDLSSFNAGNYFIISSFFKEISFRNCKLHATPGIVTGSWVDDGASIVLINTDSGDTKTKFAVYTRQGTLLSTESIYNSTSGTKFGNSSGPNIGWQITTTADCNEANPFIIPVLCNGWDDAASAVTATVKLIHDSATALHNRNLWMEVSYVSSATFPQGSLASNRNATPFDGSTADHASDSDSWTGTGGFSNANKQKLEKAFTPAEGSAIEARIFVGVASKTLYIDPVITVA